MTTFRTDRSLLLERDPAKLEDGRRPLESMKDADWLHQRAAMSAGYANLAEMAIDELITLVRDLQIRVDALEGRMPGATANRTPRGEIAEDK